MLRSTRWSRSPLAKLEENAEEEEEPAKRGGGGGGGGGGGPVNQRHRVASDPDSRLVRQTIGKSYPSYKSHRALDDKAGVITALQTTNGIRDDGAEQPAPCNTRRTRPANHARWWRHCKYGTSANFIALAGQGIRSRMGDRRSRLRNHQQKDIYPRHVFGMMSAATLTSVRRAAAFTGITSIVIAVTMTIGRGLECAGAVPEPNTAPVPRPGAA